MNGDNIVELPLGLGMALAQNTNAMQAFVSMSKEQQQEIVNRTHSFSPKKEMKMLVDSIGSGNFYS